MSKVNVWWPMYCANFTMDTACLTNEEIGIYIKLLNAAWHNDGAISSNPKLLARLVGVSSYKWKQVSKSLQPLFTEEDGKWRSDWLSEELTKAKANSEKKRQNANQRWGKPKDTGMQMQCKGNANAYGESMQMQCPIPVPIPDTTCVSRGTVPDEAQENDEKPEIGILGGAA